MTDWLLIKSLQKIKNHKNLMKGSYVKLIEEIKAKKSDGFSTA